ANLRSGKGIEQKIAEEAEDCFPK
ncbi:MAG: hypothetical protein RLZZ69_1934, partial [Cyanobacteriota bacterium]